MVPDTQTNPTRIPRFRWRIFPAMVFGILGLLATCYGVYGVGNNALRMIAGNGRVALFEFVALAFVGATWLLSARAFMRSQWILATSMAVFPYLAWMLLGTIL